MRTLLVFLLLSFAATAKAELPFYGEVRLGAGGVRHSDLDFFPVFGSLSAGLYLAPQIGVEGFVDIPLASGEKGVFEVEVPQASGLAVRFSSAAMRGLEAYVVFGYVAFELEQSASGSQATGLISETFTGVRTSIGIQQRLSLFPDLLVGLEYRNFATDSGVIVDGLSLGIRMDVQ